MHHIQGSCHGCILKNHDLNSGLYTIYMDHVTAVCYKEPCFKSMFIQHIQGYCHGCILKNPILNQCLYTISKDPVIAVCLRTMFYIKVYTSYPGILSWLYAKKLCFISKRIHYIYGSCHDFILKNPALNQGLCTISRDLVMAVC